MEKETMNDTMTELLIDQGDRIFEPVGKVSFVYNAMKAEKLIVNFKGGQGYASEN